MNRNQLSIAGLTLAWVLIGVDGALLARGMSSLQRESGPARSLGMSIAADGVSLFASEFRGLFDLQQPTEVGILDARKQLAKLRRLDAAIDVRFFAEAMVLLQEANSAQSLDWKQRAEKYRAAGIAFAVVQPQLPSSLERSADAMVACGDLAAANGAESLARQSYRSAVALYQDIESMTDAAGSMRARTLRKRLSISADLAKLVDVRDDQKER